MDKKWNWLPRGMLFGLTFLIVVWAIKPIGFSTQFAILNGIVGNVFYGELSKENISVKVKYIGINAFFNKYIHDVKDIVSPLNYSFVFSMLLGGFVSNQMLKNKYKKFREKDFEMLLF